jgi:hypothetical protein
MMASSEPAFADLASLRLAIAASPILVLPPTLCVRLADWERTRRSADVDEVILAWLASEARQARMARRFDA